MALRPASAPPRDSGHAGTVPVADDLRTVMLHRLSWGAVLAGAASALVVQLVLTLIGIGVGLAAVSATTGDNPGVGTLSQGALLWWVFSGLFASAVGGSAPVAAIFAMVPGSASTARKSLSSRATTSGPQSA